MFLTRSIRRKLVFGLALVLVMLTVMSLSGLWGLASYRNLVNDPAVDDRSVVSAADVARAVAVLRWSVPLHNGPLETPFDPDVMQTRLDTAQDLCAAYRTRLNELPPGLRYNQSIAPQLIGQISEGLATLEQSLHDPAGHPPMAVLAARLDQLGRAAVELPELPDGLRDTLRAARRDYRQGLVLVSVCASVVVVLLIGLVRFGHRQVFQPISSLHQGARRVAQGDFDYRVSINSQDEMGELAESFNLMTERFQEIAADLDRQVQERSRQLVRSERLASVGFLAAGVAHEINNPLSAIRWAGESLESRLAQLMPDAPDDEAAVVQQYVAMIQSESERCQEITKRLLDFSRSQDSAKTRQDVCPIIREVVTLITHMKKYRERRIELDHASSCEAEISGPEIKQVALNLVANALDASAPDGHVAIQVVEQVDWIELHFMDDGCGLEADDIERLFEPFHTTKSTGEGTGLGLSISDRIARDHGGIIEAHSAGPGMGSTFILRLPRVQSGSTQHDTKHATRELQRVLAR